MTRDFDTYNDAAYALTADGLVFSHSSPFSGREYWSKKNGKDTLLDHSATIDACGSKFIVCAFYEREAAA